MYEETKPTNTGAEEQPADAPKQLLVDMGSTVVRNSRGTIHCLTIIGQIEGHCAAPQGTKTTKYEHVLPLLAGLEQSEDVDGCSCSTPSAATLRRGSPLPSSSPG